MLKHLMFLKIDSLKLTSTNSNSKLKALELRKQSFIPQSSSQEAVKKVNAVLNPPIDLNKLPFPCDECVKSFATSFGLSVLKRIHNKNKNTFFRLFESGLTRCECIVFWLAFFKLE